MVDEDEVVGDPVCVVCKSNITDPKSLLPCTQCHSCFHQSGCSGVTDFRGFNVKRSTWKCPSCDACAFEQGRKRQRSETGDTVVIDTDVFRELLETIRSLNTNVIELKHEIAGVKGELMEVRKLNQNLIESQCSNEKKNTDKRILSFADVASNRRHTPSRQPTLQQSQKIAPAPKLNSEEVITNTNSPLVNVNSQDDGFRPVGPRKRFRKPLVIGELVSDVESASQNFEGSERRHWVYVGRVKSGTTPENITSFVKSTWKIDDILCNQLASRDGISSFKVGVRESHIPSLLDASKWPKGVAVREFVFVPKRVGIFGNKDTENFQKTDVPPMET